MQVKVERGAGERDDVWVCKLIKLLVRGGWRTRQTAVSQITYPCTILVVFFFFVYIPAEKYKQIEVGLYLPVCVGKDTFFFH